MTEEKKPEVVKTPKFTKMYIAKQIFTPGSTVYGYVARQMEVKEGEEPLVEVDVPTANVKTEKKREGRRLMTKTQYDTIRKAERG